ncbi:MAG: hypothetical protein ABSE49_15825 [Polyangiaceae bacterium]
MTFGLTLGGVAGAPRSVQADALPNGQDQAHPCRPTISCTADLVAPGTFEAEIGGAVSGATTGHVASFPLLLKQTLTRFLQIQVGSNGYSVATDSSSASQLRYVDNVFVGPKVHLRDQGDGWPSLALSAVASIPAFQADGVTREDDVFLTAYASEDVGVVHVDWNVGADVWRVEQAPATQAFTALALSVSPVQPLGLAVEGYYFSEAAPVAPHDGGVRVAMSVAPRSWLVADLGGDAGFFPSTRAYTFFFGMTVIPAVLWRPEAPTP